ncbi:MAG: hypothetical protein IH851_00510 [Armatimonadetes bacterium]|nr:hypothetical protein [Armatimonadota bacterium]
MRRGKGIPKGRPFKPIYVRAFRARKSVKGWSEDARCVVPYITLLQRLRRGWPPEAAITTAAALSKRAASAMSRRGERPVRLYGGFGEKKSAYAWSRDPRCQVAETTLRQRLDRGIRAGIAIKMELPARLGRSIRLYTAYGESKSLHKWAKDRRCQVSYDTLRKRVQRGARLTGAMKKKRVAN